MKNKSCSAYTLGMPPFEFSKQTHGNRMFPPDGKNVFNSVSQINYSTLTMFVAKKSCSSSRTAGWKELYFLYPWMKIWTQTQ